MTTTPHTEQVLILDFGSQVTQLIARRVREAGVYCEVLPCTVSDARIREFNAKAIILSGSPASTTWETAPSVPQAVFDAGVPIMGICYGEQTLCAQMGGAVETSESREFGRAFLDIKEDCALFDGVWQPGERHQVWMSHGDRITAIPEGFRVVATSEGSPFAAIANDEKRIYAVQFHPEVVHTPDGGKLLANFVHKVAGFAGDWSMAA
ncbi:MAG: glutamine-hydrolyzing GMP synthase, partial [Rhodospirillaceae bacterium]|nr:glutamine-hydrolyzing GMP synthase [Rhodospirillaceae bacterium]